MRTTKKNISSPSKRSKTTKTRSKTVKPKTEATQIDDIPFEPRPLCVVNIYNSINDPLYAIQNILTQTYNGNIYYIFNIIVDNKNDISVYKKITKGISNTGSKINYLLKSANHHILTSIKDIDYHKYNMFILLDNNIIYQPQYIQQLINQYNYTNDIVNIIHHKTTINQNYIMNNKSLDLMIKYHLHQSLSWSDIIEEHKLHIASIDAGDLCLPTPHQSSNINDTDPSSDNIQYNLIENDFCTICIFEHNFWSSYIYLNKRNNRMYNIYNDDHGAFEIIDANTIKIKWDTWGEETFYRHLSGRTFYYSIHK